MVLEGLGVVFSATLGAIEALGVLFNDHWVVLVSRGSCGCLQCHIRGYKGSWGAIRWALSDTRRSCDRWSSLFSATLGARYRLSGCYSKVSEWY